jgi:tetratricopeptide (TPR) repeat protein
MPTRRLALLLLLACLTLLAPLAWALSSGDYIKQGITALKAGKDQQAFDLFSKAQKLDPNSPKPHYYIATALVHLGEPDSARTEFQTAIRMDPKYVDALTGLGRLERDQGNKEQGTQYLETAVKYDSKDAPALYALGNAYLADKRYPDAEKIFRKGMLLKEGRALFLAGTALALEGEGDLKGAETLFIRARETDPNSLRVRMEFGGFYSRKGIPALAAPEYGRASELDPHNPETHYLYGKALVGMNEYNAGLAAFVAATAEDSTYAPAYLAAGDLFYRAGRYPEAAEKFRLYVGLEPDDYEGYLDLGRALSKSKDPGDRAEAITVLTRANDLKPDVPEVLGALCKLYVEQGADGRDSAIEFCDKFATLSDTLTAEENLRVGTLYVAQDDSASAFKHLTEAVAQDSTMAKDAYFQLGFLFFSRRDYAAAAPYFEQTLQVDPRFLPALLNLALCDLQAQKKSEAIAILRRALEVKPNDARAMVWIAQTMMSMEPDSLPSALEMYRAAIEADSTNGDALRGAGLALVLMDNCVEAQTYLVKAAELEPDHVQGHVWLAQTYAKCRDIPDAKIEFNKALDIDPNNEQASKGLENIRKWEQQQQQRSQAAAGTSTE